MKMFKWWRKWKGGVWYRNVNTLYVTPIILEIESSWSKTRQSYVTEIEVYSKTLGYYHCKRNPKYY